MWFEQLTGFNELSPEFVRKNLSIEGDSFVSRVNDKKFAFGDLQIATLEELRELSPPLDSFNARLRVSEIVADVKELHCNIENTNALFQAASQFNLLEMVGPHISPEQGVDRYEHDYTQGPACAIACGAGTIYRNYFVKLDHQIGQTSENQVDCLDLIGEELKNNELNLWQMQNGYALANKEGLLKIDQMISALNIEERDRFKDKLKIGIQWNTEVTQAISRHRVSQVYCSALPVAYSNIESKYWETFSRVVLEATYEATLYAALLNYKKTNSNLVYLTLVGGVAFGNEEHWILDSLSQVLDKFRNTPLKVQVVSYGQTNHSLVERLRLFQ